ncbi:hypothetical protein NQ152_15890 [Microbacterium sp. zg.B48]|uniref:hypothetical protein n=1 Tax=Microbacterium sp. zg.B48 TaxID=2969408 RepID=UPI00214C6286|nr:hypothetical protein [Microbacterium sp. zg.B48]MCR2764987.1 hypothetical protein [Microbacterium sp. zg.B48]
MSADPIAEHLVALQEDLAYHQTRVLLLVVAVSTADGHARKLDGLTKLAKLDFLTRYPALASRVLRDLSPHDARLHISGTEALAPTDVEDPMIRYKYGPWDDRYYPVIGSLVGRSLLKYVRGRQGSVALAPTPAGKRFAADVASLPQWRAVGDRCEAIAEASAGLTGNGLKELIYRSLADLMNRPHRELIK